MDIRFAPEAKGDLDEIFDYILERDPQAAVHTLERLDKSIRSLGEQPHLGRPGRVPETRELVVPQTSFIVPYQVTGSTIEILRVYHGARLWPEHF